MSFSSRAGISSPSSRLTLAAHAQRASEPPISCIPVPRPAVTASAPLLSGAAVTASLFVLIVSAIGAAARHPETDSSLSAAAERENDRANAMVVRAYAAVLADVQRDAGGDERHPDELQARRVRATLPASVERRPPICLCGDLRTAAAEDGGGEDEGGRA